MTVVPRPADGSVPTPPQVTAPTEVTAPQVTAPDEVTAPQVTAPTFVTAPARGTVLSRVAALPVTLTGRARGRLRAAWLALVAWTRRAGVRLVLATTMVLALVGLAVFVGGFLTPALPLPTHRALTMLGPTGAGDDGSDAAGTDDGDGAAPPAAVTPGDGTDATKPADLAAWAAPLAARLAIPQPAMQAYGFAEMAIAAAKPGCQLRWTTLAGIGKVESAHGQSHATLAPDGTALPPIVGAALDGTGGRMRVVDTDGGQIDGDVTWDHAVGPMQFIPSTWTAYAADADSDGVSDINNINDASLAAARYLCAANRNMSIASDWWPAVLSYNAVQSYAQDVFDAANDYGTRSR
jgi:hypothetical protein